MDWKDASIVDELVPDEQVVKMAEEDLRTDARPQMQKWADTIAGVSDEITELLARYKGQQYNISYGGSLDNVNAMLGEALDVLRMGL